MVVERDTRLINMMSCRPIIISANFASLYFPFEALGSHHDQRSKRVEALDSPLQQGYTIRNGPVAAVRSYLSQLLLMTTIVSLRQ